jgi:hypothetical protein
MQSSGDTSAPSSLRVPAPQHAMRTVLQKAVEALDGQSAPQLQWLGARPSGPSWRLPVMDGHFLVAPVTGEVFLPDGSAVRPAWQILALHYLAVRARPAQLPAEVSFANFPSARTYASVYEQRVNRRICAGAGKDAAAMEAAATAVGARRVCGGDMSFEIHVFPRVPIRIVWYGGDEDFPSSCTLLLPDNTEAFFCTEDIVVLSESLAARWGGQPF